MSAKQRRKNLAFRSCPNCEAKISIRKRECEFCGTILRKRKYTVYGDPSTAQSKKKQTSTHSPKVSPPTTNIDETMSSQSLGVVSPPSSSDDSSLHHLPPTTPPQNHEPPTHNESNQQNPIPSPSTQESNPIGSTRNASMSTMAAVTSPSSQPPTLPDFMTALNMTPTTSSDAAVRNGSSQKTDRVDKNGRVEHVEGGNSDSKSNGPSVEESEEQGGSKDEEQMDIDGSSSQLSVKESLMEKFKRDPNEVLQLLQSALSVDKLSSLISEAYQSDKEQLQQLQTQLEAAYHILKDCTEQKESLTNQINETGDKIKSKRKHLETLREELQSLGEEELHIKRRRDTAFETCSELKRKLRSSRDALHQMSILSPSVTTTEHAQFNSKDASTSVADPSDRGGSGNVAEIKSTLS